MRTLFLPVKITIPFPFDRPDQNGVIYTKEAVKNALENLQGGLPIIFFNNSSYEPTIVGNTSLADEPIIVCDDEKQTYQVSIKGLLYAGGAECIVGKMDNGKVSEFQIISVGISQIDPVEKEASLNDTERTIN